MNLVVQKRKKYVTPSKNLLITTMFVEHLLANAVGLLGMYPSVRKFLHEIGIPFIHFYQKLYFIQNKLKYFNE